MKLIRQLFTLVTQVLQDHNKRPSMKPLVDLQMRWMVASEMLLLSTLIFLVFLVDKTQKFRLRLPDGIPDQIQYLCTSTKRRGTIRFT
ncbi:hypothetical protein OPV22_014462 [Ensete ventricosum]|uniref:Uncharacterized protein n=1 Tax=Ensete ventricosum TaxID=4639 RepID=A0AAV8R639_ENSVE|nr:hypothetical protein OPV22_014462 [Ensete ventricosum]